jgi:hypothetical protein
VVKIREEDGGLLHFLGQVRPNMIIKIVLRCQAWKAAALNTLLKTGRNLPAVPLSGSFHRGVSAAAGGTAPNDETQDYQDGQMWIYVAKESFFLVSTDSTGSPFFRNSATRLPLWRHKVRAIRISSVAESCVIQPTKSV